MGGTLGVDLGIWTAAGVGACADQGVGRTGYPGVSPDDDVLRETGQGG
jgi:hypothetical protein